MAKSYRISLSLGLLLITVFLTIILTRELGNSGVSEPSQNMEIELRDFSFDGEKYICDGAAYRNKISVQGQSRNAEGNTTYVVLTNKTSVDFDAVDKEFWSCRRFSAGKGGNLPALCQKYVIVAMNFALT